MMTIGITNGSSDKCVVFVPKRWTEMKIAKILSLPLVTPN
jgi:hypothetical protein